MEDPWDISQDHVKVIYHLDRLRLPDDIHSEEQQNLKYFEEIFVPNFEKAEEEAEKTNFIFKDKDFFIKTITSLYQSEGLLLETDIGITILKYLKEKDVPMAEFYDFFIRLNIIIYPGYDDYLEFFRDNINPTVFYDVTLSIHTNFEKFYKFFMNKLIFYDSESLEYCLIIWNDFHDIVTNGVTDENLSQEIIEQQQQNSKQIYEDFDWDLVLSKTDKLNIHDCFEQFFLDWNELPISKDVKFVLPEPLKKLRISYNDPQATINLIHAFLVNGTQKNYIDNFKDVIDLTHPKVIEWLNQENYSWILNNDPNYRFKQIALRIQALNALDNTAFFKWQDLCKITSKSNLKELKYIAKFHGIDTENLSKRKICALLAKQMEKDLVKDNVNCINEWSILGEPVNQIQKQFLFKHDGYCFHILELKDQFRNNIFFNPFTNQKFPDNIISEIQEKINLLEKIVKENKFQVVDILKEIKMGTVLSPYQVLDRKTNIILSKLKYNNIDSRTFLQKDDQFFNNVIRNLNANNVHVKRENQILKSTNFEKRRKFIDEMLRIYSHYEEQDFLDTFIAVLDECISLATSN